MCRLFALSGAPRRVRATFWLLEAPDSIAEQSHDQPDGSGIGWFDAGGAPHVDREPVPAYSDPDFARAARELESSTYIAHLRYASTGAAATRNTHPFEQHRRLLAHNGVIAGLDELDAELGPYRALVQGETDSERFLALVTRAVDEGGGDVGAGLARAAAWVAERLPLYALNVVLATATDVWALRYPATHELWLLERGAGGPSAAGVLDASSAAGTVRVRSADLASSPAVVVATERMDDDPGWRLIRSGELVHVAAGGAVSSARILPEPPRYPLALADLDPRAASSQATGRRSRR